MQLTDSPVKMRWLGLFFSLYAVLSLASSTPSQRNLQIISDSVYFPDQVEYIRAAYGKCAGSKRLYWPGDGRCYAEGSRGPCPWGFLLEWEERWLRPRCQRLTNFDNRNRRPTPNRWEQVSIH